VSMCPDCGRPLTKTVITDVPCSKLATECGAHVHPAWAEECQERTVEHLSAQLAQQAADLAKAHEALKAAAAIRKEARVIGYARAPVCYQEFDDAMATLGVLDSASQVKP